MEDVEPKQGIGIAWEGGEFRLVQEFVRRYVVWTRPLPRAASIDEPLIGSGAPAPGYRIELQGAVDVRGGSGIYATHVPPAARMPSFMPAAVRTPAGC